MTPIIDELEQFAAGMDESDHPVVSSQIRGNVLRNTFPAYKQMAEAIDMRGNAAVNAERLRSMQSDRSRADEDAAIFDEFRRGLGEVDQSDPEAIASYNQQAMLKDPRLARVDQARQFMQEWDQVRGTGNRIKKEKMETRDLEDQEKYYEVDQKAERAQKELALAQSEHNLNELRSNQLEEKNMTVSNIHEQLGAFDASDEITQGVGKLAGLLDKPEDMGNLKQLSSLISAAGTFGSLKQFSTHEKNEHRRILNKLDTLGGLNQSDDEIARKLKGRESRDYSDYLKAKSSMDKLSAAEEAHEGIMKYIPEQLEKIHAAKINNDNDTFKKEMSALGTKISKFKGYLTERNRENRLEVEQEKETLAMRKLVEGMRLAKTKEERQNAENQVRKKIQNRAQASSVVKTMISEGLLPKGKGESDDDYSDRVNEQINKLSKPLSGGAGIGPEGAESNGEIDPTEGL